MTVTLEVPKNTRGDTFTWPPAIEHRQNRRNGQVSTEGDGREKRRQVASRRSSPRPWLLRLTRNLKLQTCDCAVAMMEFCLPSSAEALRMRRCGHRCVCGVGLALPDLHDSLYRPPPPGDTASYGCSCDSLTLLVST